MSYDDLLAYNLVVLADVDAESLGDIGREMLKDYVAAGGGLLVLGGPYAYGEGGYGKGQLAEVLPVQVGGAFDLVAGGELAAGGASALPGSLDWKQRPVAPYVHRLTPKPQAVVAVTAGGLPFVVTGTYGQGRVACVAGSPVGAAAGRTVFWQWSDWPRLVGKLAEWARAVPPAVP
jgi:uncharacterized membrane protein